MTEPLACGVLYEEHRDISYTITGESRENARNWEMRGTLGPGSFHFAMTLYNKFLVRNTKQCCRSPATA